MQFYGMWDIIPTLVRKLEERVVTKLTLAYNHVQWGIILLCSPWCFLILAILLT